MVIFFSRVFFSPVFSSPVMALSPVLDRSRSESRRAIDGMKILCFAGPEQEPVDTAQNDEQAAPPHGSMQLSELHIRRRAVPFRKSTHKNHDSVHQEQHTHEKPDGNDVMFFAHVLSPENDLQNYENR